VGVGQDAVGEGQDQGAVAGGASGAGLGDGVVSVVVLSKALWVWARVWRHPVGSGPGHGLPRRRRLRRVGSRATGRSRPQQSIKQHGHRGRPSRVKQQGGIPRSPSPSWSWSSAARW
jgi:hypothetical protein